MEGICFSLNSFVTKFNNAVGVLGVIVGLMVVEYVQPVESGVYLPQSDATKDGMFALATLIPAIGFALSLIPMFFYDYTGKRKERILAELEERRAEKTALAAAADGGEIRIDIAEAEPAVTESVFVTEDDSVLSEKTPPCDIAADGQESDDRV